MEGSQSKLNFKPDCYAVHIGFVCLTLLVLCHVIQCLGLALGPRIFVNINMSVLHLASKRLTC